MAQEPGAEKPLPTSPQELESEIVQRRARLAATIDELSTRTQPKEIARRGVAGAQSRALAAVYTPEGQLRSERVAAVAGAVVVVVTALVWLRRRR